MPKMQSGTQETTTLSPPGDSPSRAPAPVAATVTPRPVTGPEAGTDTARSNDNEYVIAPAAYSPLTDAERDEGYAAAFLLSASSRPMPHRPLRSGRTWSALSARGGDDYRRKMGRKLGLLEAMAVVDDDLCEGNEPDRTASPEDGGGLVRRGAIVGDGLQEIRQEEADRAPVPAAEEVGGDDGCRPERDLSRRRRAVRRGQAGFRPGRLHADLEDHMLTVSSSYGLEDVTASGSKGTELFASLWISGGSGGEPPPPFPSMATSSSSARPALPLPRLTVSSSFVLEDVTASVVARRENSFARPKYNKFHVKYNMRKSRSITGPTETDRRRWFGLDRCNGRGIRPDRGAPRPDVLAPRSARSSTTQHDLNPPLRRYGRSGARAPSIYIGREPDAATSIPDGAADAKFNIPVVALACY
ncbi:hypothetical protein THAOC_12141 [Thalassiosira oceanica]|uniref:Uncharacterized protein n=1 Tax=Thalassiosira oceanica TaxID=159749 RepID=K0T8P3_THAOC|nr:hypothetical protein THAOC_12141 [Thalassiosira oceanica]|eukprot:EJK66892.1 hypothetical protein THAOC_12141 [Thalassiosira oceanica]